VSDAAYREVMRLRPWSWPSLLVVASLAGCGGGGDDHADAGRDLSVYGNDLAFEPSDAGLADFSGLDTVGICTLIANEAKSVAAVTGQGTLPVPMGGTLVDGLYFLTALQRYPNSTLTDTTLRRTARLSGGGTMFEDVIDVSGTGETRSAYAITLPGTQINLSSLPCDQPDVTVTYGYTVSGRNLVFIDSGQQVTYTFEQQ
jgi:hypothetical protein